MFAEKVNFWTILVMAIMVLNGTSCANIFAIFPTPSYSHQQPMLALSHALARKGHNLTVITANPSKVPLENHTDIDIGYFYDKWKGRQKDIGFTMQKRQSAYKWMSQCPSGIHHFCEMFLSSDEVQELIRSKGKQFDLIIYESLYPCTLGFVPHFGYPPVVALLSIPSHTYTDFMLGNPINPSYMPLYLSPYNDRLTFYERICNTYLYLYLLYLQLFYTYSDQEKIKLRYFGSGLPSIKEMASNVSLVIYSTDMSSGYPRPLNPNVIMVGPLHLLEPKQLPHDIQSWMDGAKEGVILFSLGTNMQGTSLSEEIRAVFMKAFSMFPDVRVLWKWESDERIPGQPDNVQLKKWIPQQDILAHPKIRLFISQVGLQSFQEAIHYAVPILAIPVFGDQDYNTKKLLQEGAGLALELHETTLEVLHKALNDLLTKTCFKENMLRLSAISKDKPNDSITTAIWWVEYVLRHKGAPHLRSKVVQLKWYEAYLLDVIAVTIVVPSVVIYYIVSKLQHFLKASTLPNLEKKNV